MGGSPKRKMSFGGSYISALVFAFEYSRKSFDKTVNSMYEGELICPFKIILNLFNIFLQIYLFYDFVMIECT